MMFFSFPLITVFVLAVLALMLLLVGYRVIRHEAPDWQFLVIALAFAVVVRLAAVFIVPEIMQGQFGIPYVTPSDPRAFDETAQAIAQRPHSSWHIRRGHAYPYILASMYRTFGHTLLAPRLFNVFCSLLLIVYTYDLADSLFEETVARLSTLGVALFPSLILLTVRIGDDLLSILLIVAGVYYMISVRSELLDGIFPLRSVSAFVGTIFIIYYVRNQIAWVLLGVSLMWLVFLLGYRLPTSKRKWYFIGSGVVALGVAAVFVALEPAIVPHILADPNQWVGSNIAEARGGLAGKVRAAPVVFRAFLGTIALVLMPFPPWEVLLARRHAPAYFFATSSLLIYLILPLVLVGLKRALADTDRLSQRLPAILTFGILVAGIAVIYGGTVPRFRTTIVVFILMFAAAGLSATDEAPVFYVSYLGIAGITVGYYLL